jgi:hypothetical protein
VVEVRARVGVRVRVRVRVSLGVRGRGRVRPSSLRACSSWIRSSTCDVDEEQRAPRPVLGRAGEAGWGGEAAGSESGCRFEGDGARGEAGVSRAEVVGASEEGEELWVGTRSGQRATEAARTTPLAGEGSLAGEGGCEVESLFGEAGGEAVAPAAVARPNLERHANLSQSWGETAGCGSAVAT